MKYLNIMFFSIFYAYLCCYISVSLNYVPNKLNTKKFKRITIFFIFPHKGNNGPVTLVSAYIRTIRILALQSDIRKYFDLIIKNCIPFEYFSVLARNSSNIIWFLFSDYFLKIIEYKSVFKNTIYGPMVSPKKWTKFPLQNTYEQNWTDYIKHLFAYIVQSERVKLYLINKSKIENNIYDKYIVSHGCMLINTTYNIMNWNLREYDILIYVKFADINKQKELNLLIRFLQLSYSIKIIRYGNHTKESLLYYANNSRLLIYFSYYDCWPSSLMEMESMGVIPIVEQCEFIHKYGYCIENFVTNLHHLNKTIHNLLVQTHNSAKVSKYYIRKNDCKSILRNTLFEIYNRKINQNTCR